MHDSLSIFEMRMGPLRKELWCSGRESDLQEEYPRYNIWLKGLDSSKWGEGPLCEIIDNCCQSERTISIPDPECWILWIHCTDVARNLPVIQEWKFLEPEKNATMSTKDQPFMTWNLNNHVPGSMQRSKTRLATWRLSHHIQGQETAEGGATFFCGYSILDPTQWGFRKAYSKKTLTSQTIE